MHTRHECLWTTHVSLHHTCRPDALALRSFWWFSAQCWEMEKFKIFLEYDPTKLNTISYSCRWHFWKFGKTFMKLSKKSVAKPSMRVSRYRIQFCVVLHLHLRQYDVKHLLALSKNCFFLSFRNFMKFLEVLLSFLCALCELVFYLLAYVYDNDFFVANFLQSVSQRIWNVR